MYKRVLSSFGNVVLEETGVCIGKEGRAGNGFFEVELTDTPGKTVLALYGTVYNGEFHQFCTGTMCVGCRGVTSPKCRYNRETNKNSGYYVDM